MCIRLLSHVFVSHQLGSSSFNKFVDLFPKDPKCHMTSDPNIVSGLATVTMALPFLGKDSIGGVGAAKADADSKRNKSVLNLHYTNFHSSGELVKEGGVGQAERRYEREREEAVLEEWDEFLT